MNENVDDPSDSLKCFSAIRDYLKVHGNHELSNEDDKYLFERLHGDEGVKELLRKFTDDNQAPSKLLVVTHSSLIKKLLVRDEQADKEKPIKFRVLAQNSEIYPFTFDFYDNIRSDAREKDGSVKKEKKPKEPKAKKTPNGTDEP